jgi:hypothetical protein
MITNVLRVSASRPFVLDGRGVPAAKLTASQPPKLTASSASITRSAGESL